MTAMTTTPAKKPSKLTTAACELFGVTADRIPAVLWALDIRATCGRCGGSGRYSRCQMYGDMCFGCSGRGKVAAKLTRETFEAARVKVEAGELAAVRARATAQRAARREIAPLVARAREVYSVIGDAYTVAGRAGWAAIPEPLFRAQTMNNSLFWGDRIRGCSNARSAVSEVESEVKSGRRRDYLACKAEIEAAILDLEALVAAWHAFEAA